MFSREPSGDLRMIASRTNWEMRAFICTVLSDPKKGTSVQF